MLKLHTCLYRVTESFPYVEGKELRVIINIMFKKKLIWRVDSLHSQQFHFLTFQCRCFFIAFSWSWSVDCWCRTGSGGSTVVWLLFGCCLAVVLYGPKYNKYHIKCFEKKRINSADFESRHFPISPPQHGSMNINAFMPVDEEHDSSFILAHCFIRQTTRSVKKGNYWLR